ncbi:MAG: MliC family protein [Methylocystis silviterrae]|uniref:MliC family protein n=1 Tax=Methylocystis silviterrae TaxID=2743612 RepID=UPI003C78E2AB
MNRSLVIVAAVLAAAAPLAAAHAKATVRDPFVFTCSGDPNAALTVTFLGANANRAKLVFKGETVMAKQAMAASGARYVAKNIEFWNKGDDAMVEWRGKKLNCTTRN